MTRNNRHIIKVTDTRVGDTETLVLVFTNRNTAMKFYAELPNYLDASWPKPEGHKVYGRVNEAITDTIRFFDKESVSND